MNQCAQLITIIKSSAVVEVPSLALYNLFIKEKSTKCCLIVCFLLATFISILFYPGCFSFDSFYQYQQAETKEFDSWHPVIMALVMRLLRHSLGPGGLLFFHQYLIWFSLFLIISSLFKKRIIYFCVGFLPHLFLLNLCVWKDIGMNSALMISTGFLMQFLYRKQLKIYLIGAFLGIWYATLVRMNGITISIFYLMLISLCLWKYLKLSIAKSVGIIFFSIVVIIGSYLTINYAFKVKQMFPITTTLIHDIAGITYLKTNDENKSLPNSLKSSVRDEFKNDANEKWYKTYTPDSCGSVCWGNGVFDCVPKNKSQFDGILELWKNEVVSNSKEYLLHRTMVFKELMQYSKISYHRNFDENLRNDLSFHPTWLALHVYDKINKIYYKSYNLLFIFVKPYILLFINFVSLLFIVIQIFSRNIFSKNDSKMILLLSLSNISSALGLYFTAPADDYRYNIFLLSSTLLIYVFYINRIYEFLTKKASYSNQSLS